MTRKSDEFRDLAIPSSKAHALLNGVPQDFVEQNNLISAYKRRQFTETRLKRKAERYGTYRKS